MTLQTVYKNVKVCNCIVRPPLTPIAKELLMAVQKEREVIGVKPGKKWRLRVSHLMKESFSKWSECIGAMQQPHLTRDYHHHW